MSCSSPETTGPYPSTTWSRIAHSAARLPVARSSGRCSSRCLAPRKPLATRRRTVVAPATILLVSTVDDHPGPSSPNRARYPLPACRTAPRLTPARSWLGGAWALHFLRRHVLYGRAPIVLYVRGDSRGRGGGG